MRKRVRRRFSSESRKPVCRTGFLVSSLREGVQTGTPDREEGIMKRSVVGIVAVAVLLVVTGIGFGIAQAGGTHTERPVLSFAEAVEQGSSSGFYAEVRPVLSFEDQELQTARSRSEDLRLESPMETGAIPARGSEEPWMREYGHD
jgi:hypothetical protein